MFWERGSLLLMVFSPLSIFFLWFMFCGTFVTLMSSNWFIAWVGMEMNLLAFLPWVMEDKGGGVIQASVQYFIAQGVGSIFFLLAGMVSYSELYEVSGLIGMTGLLVKAGSVPVHQWLPSVVENLSWCRVTVILTWQKLSPLLMCVSVVEVGGSGVCVLLALFNSYVGVFGGLNQTSLRPLLGYSSISHLGWIIALMVMSSSAAMWYLVGYIVLIFSVGLFFMSGGGGDYIVDVKECKGVGGKEALLFMGLILSVGGLPPFFGFFLKLFALMVLVESWVCGAIALFLLVGSLVSLIYYLNLVFVFFKVAGGYSGSILAHGLVKKPFLFQFFLMVSLCGGVVPIFFFF